MKKAGNSQAESFVRLRVRHDHLRRTVAILSAFVMLFTMNTLKRDADTLQRIPMCHMEEHTHTPECYDAEGVLICGLPEHVHTDACYQERPVPEEEVDLAAVTEDVEYDLADVTVPDGGQDDAPTEAAPVEEAAPAEAPVEMPVFRLHASATLSEIIGALNLPVAIKDVQTVGPVENDEAHTGLVRTDALDGDVLVSAQCAFDEAELAIVTGDDILVVKLIDGAPVEEAVEETTEEAVEQEPSETTEEEITEEITEETTEEETTEETVEETSGETTEEEITEETTEETSEEETTGEETIEETSEENIEEVTEETTEETTEEETIEETTEETTEEETIEETSEETTEEETTEETTEETSEEETTEETTEETSEEETAKETTEETSEEETAEEGTIDEITEEAAEDVGDGVDLAAVTEETFEGPTGEADEAPAGEAAEPVVEEQTFSASVSVDLSSVDLMKAATVEGDTVTLSVSQLLSGEDDAVRMEGDLDAIDLDAIVDAATVTGDTDVLDVQDGTITLSADELASGSVSLQLQTESVEDDVTTVTTQIVDIELTDYAGRTTEEIGGDATVQIVPAEGNSLPADAVATMTDAEVPENLLSAPAEGTVEAAVAYDITIKNGNDDELSETGAVEVTLLPEGLNVLDGVPEGATAGDRHYTLYHVHDDGTREVVTDAQFDVAEDGTVNNISFTTDSFSTYIFVYTVDFEYTDPQSGETFAWSFPGTGRYAIADIMAEIGVEGAISDVSLVRTEDVGGAENALYLSADSTELVSDVAFQDTFELTVTVDGVEYVITVTDDGNEQLTVNFSYGSDVTFASNAHLLITQINNNAIQSYYLKPIGQVQSTFTITTDVLNGVYGGPPASYSNSYQNNVYIINGDISETIAGNNEWKLVGDDNIRTHFPNISYLNGDYYNGSHLIRVVSDANEHTLSITIGEVGTITYTASLNVYEAWDSTPNTAASFTNSHTLTASDGTDTYTATFTAPGTLSFNTALPSGNLEWTLDNQSLSSSSTVNLEGYILAGLPSRNTTDHTYTFEFHQPNTYTASLTFQNASGGTDSSPTLDGDYYLVVNDSIYAPVDTSKTPKLGTWVGVTNDALPEINSFRFVKATGTVNGVGDLTNTVSAIGAYKVLTTQSDINGMTSAATAGSHNYAFTASLPQTCAVDLSFIDVYGSGQQTPALDDGYHYYVVAVKNNNPVGYAEFTSSSYSTLSFTGTAPDEESSLWIVRSTNGLSNTGDISSLPQADKLTASGGLLGSYAFTWDGTPVSQHFAVTGTEHNINTVEVEFYEEDGTTPLTNAPAISSRYYVIGRDGNSNPLCYAPVASNGEIGQFKDTSNAAISILENLGSVWLIKYTGSVADASMTYGELTTNYTGTYSGGPVDSDYAVVDCTPVPVNKVITLRLKLNPKTYDVAMTFDPQGPRLDSQYYYLLIKERGAYKYYVPLSEYGSFGQKKNAADGSNADNLKTAYGFTFELVKAQGEPSNIDGLSSLTKISSIGATVNSAPVTYNVVMPTGATLVNNNPTYVVTASESTSRTASIQFYDGWNVENNNANIVSGLTLVGTANSTTYTANVTGSSTRLSFSDGTNDDVELPAISDWAFKVNNATVTEINGYTLTGPTQTGNNYAFEARKPDTYTASLTFQNASGTTANPTSLDGYYYLVINDTYYAPVTTTGLGDWVGVTNDGLPAITTFKFVHLDTAASGIGDMNGSGLTKIGEYSLPTATPTADSSHNYAFVAQLPAECTVNISVSDASALDVYSHYYVVASRNGADIGYAALVTATGAAFTDGADGVTIYDDTTFWILKSQSALNSLSDIGTPSAANTVTTTGGELDTYLFTLPAAPESGVFQISAVKQQYYALEMDFPANETVTLGSDYYYLLVKDTNNAYKYYAKLTTTGFTDLTKADGSTATEITEAGSFEIVRTSDSNPSFSTLQGLDKIPGGGTIGEYYTVAFPASAENGAYTFTATRQANTVNVQFTNLDGTSATPVFDYYYYLVAKVGGERKYFAPIPGNVNDGLTFKDAAGTTGKTLPNATFELVKSDTEITAFANLPVETETCFKAGSVDYSFYGSPALVGTVYTINSTEKSGNRVLFSFKDSNNQIISSPSVPTGYFVAVNGKENNADVYCFAPINANGTVGEFTDASGNPMEMPAPVQDGLRIVAVKDWNCNDSLKINNGGTFGDYVITYPNIAASTNGQYIFQATKPVAYFVEIRMLDAAGSIAKPASDLSGNYAIAMVLDRDGDLYAYSKSDDLNPGSFAQKTLVLTSFKNNADEEVSYAAGDSVEVYFGTDLNWNGTNYTVGNPNNVIRTGTLKSLKNDSTTTYCFEVVTEPDRTIYIGRPVPTHTVNVQLDAAPETGVTYKVKAVEDRYGTTYSWTSDPLTFNANKATAALTTLHKDGSNDDGDVIVVSENTQFTLIKTDSGTDTEITSGTQEGGKLWLIATDISQHKTDIGLESLAGGYTYTIQVVKNDGSTSVDPASDFLNGNGWYVHAEMAQSDGTYEYVSGPIAAGDFDGANDNTLTGTIPMFFRRNSGGAIVQKEYVDGANVSFSLLRPAGDVSNPAWAYFADTSHINYNGLNGTAIEGRYTLSIVTDKSARTATIKLVEAPLVKLSFAAHSGADISTAIEAPAELLHPGVGKYYIYARLYVPDGVERRTGFFLAELQDTGAARQETDITDGFLTNKSMSYMAGGTYKSNYYVAGERMFETGLVYTEDATYMSNMPALLGHITDCEFSTPIRPTGSTPEPDKKYTLITHGQTAGGYRLVVTEGDRTNKVGKLDLVKLDRLSVSGEVRLANGAVATDTQDATNCYYVLAELVHDGVKSYAYKRLNTADDPSGITTPAATLNEFVHVSSDPQNGKKYYYEAGDKINYYVVKSPTAIDSVADAVAAPRFAEGQRMGVDGKYIASFEQDGNNTVAVLTEAETLNVAAHSVTIRLLDKDQVNLVSSADLTGDYYAIAYLTPKDTGAKGQVVAWNIQPIDRQTLNSSGEFIYSIGTSGFTICDANMDAMTHEELDQGTQTTSTVPDTMGYDKDKYDLTVRLYRTNDPLNTSPAPTITAFNDRDITELVTVQQYNEDGTVTSRLADRNCFTDDAPAGFDFMDPTKTDTATIVRLHKSYDKEYHVKLQLNQIDEVGISFDSGENCFVFVQLNHKSSDKHEYALLPITTVSSTQGETVEKLLDLYSKSGNCWWTQLNDNPEGDMSVFTGNEESITFAIVKAKSPLNYAEIMKQKKEGGVFTHVGESIKMYTLTVGGRTKVDTTSTDPDTGETTYKTVITDTLILTEDINGIKKGEIDAITALAREFGLYTELLSKHATDMEANIGAHRVSGPIGADYGFSDRNTDVNRVKVTKYYTGASGAAMDDIDVTLGLFNADTDELVAQDTQKTGKKKVVNGQNVTYTTGSTPGVAEFDFSALPAGNYVVKEFIGDRWVAYTDAPTNSMTVNAGTAYVTFSDGVITIEPDVNDNVNYFGSIDAGINLVDLLRHSRHGKVVTGNQANYDALVEANSENLATVYLAGTQAYSRTFNIPKDMERLRAFSARLADSTSSKTVRVMNYKFSEIPGEGFTIDATDDPRYVVLNIDVTGCGRSIDLNTRVNYNGRQLDPDFGGNGREDSSKVLFNVFYRDAQGVAHPYNGHIDTTNEGAGVLLAPDAVVGSLGGNWGGTIICREAQHSGSEIHSDNPNKIVTVNTMLSNSVERPQTGDLELFKKITGSVQDRTTWFSFELTMKDSAGDPLTGTFVTTPQRNGETTVTFDQYGKATVEVRAESSLIIRGLPAGATYHVEEQETEDSEFFQLVQIENGDGYVTSDGVIKSGKKVVIRAKNAHKVGGLTISKTVAGIATTQEFNFRVTIMADGSTTDPGLDINGVYGNLYFVDGVANFTLGNGESRTVEAANLPTGRKFKVEELYTDTNGVDFVIDVTVKTTGSVTCNVDENNVVTGEISDDKNAIIVAYTNTHTNGTSYRPKVTKRLKLQGSTGAPSSWTNADLADWPDEGFTFTLAWASGLNAEDKLGATLTGTTATATAPKPTATFGGIKFDYIDTLSYPRTYHFVVTEKNGGAPGVSYAATPLDLWVHVKKNATDPSNPVLEVDDVQYGGDSYDENRAGAPANVATAAGEVINSIDKVTAAPHGNKTLTGRDWGANETFRFTLTPDVFTKSKIGKTVELPASGVDYTVDDDTKVITLTVTKPVSGTEQNFTFPAIEFKAEGTYTFLMEEVGKGATVDGTTYSGRTLRVVVTVGKTSGKLDTPTIQYFDGPTDVTTENSGYPKFTNTYTRPSSYAPTVTKSLLRGTSAAADARWPAEGFKFKLEVDSQNPAGAVPPANRFATATVSAQTAEFDDIRFTRADTYLFYITEVEPAGTVSHVKDDITYSTDKLRLTVVVTVDPSDSTKLVVKPSYDRMDSAGTVIAPNDDKITNTIPNNDTTQVSGTKTWVTGKTHGVPTLKLTRTASGVTETAVDVSGSLVWQENPASGAKLYQPSWSGSTYTYDNLPLCDSSDATYTYAVAEISFTVTVGTTTYTYTIESDGTITVTPSAGAPRFVKTVNGGVNFVNTEVTSASVEKQWDGAADVSKVTSVTYRLTRKIGSAEEVVEDVTVIASPWGKTWSNLPAYGTISATSGEYTYVAREIGFVYDGKTYIVAYDEGTDSYAVSSADGSPFWKVTRSGDTFTNDLDETYLDVVKQWQLNGVDVTDPDDSNITSISFYLYRSDNKLIDGQTKEVKDYKKESTHTDGAEPFTLTKVNNAWRMRIDGLEKTDASGVPYTYWIDEVPISGYATPTIVVVRGGSAEEINSTNHAAAGEEIVVTNNRFTVAMPSTGGVGTGVIYAAGVGLLLLAAIGWVLRARKRDYDA